MKTATVVVLVLCVAVVAGFAPGGANGTSSAVGSMCRNAENSTIPTCKLHLHAVCEGKFCYLEITAFIFPLLAIVIGLVLQPLSRALHLPYTLLLLAAGTGLGALGCGVRLGWLTLSLQQWTHISPPDLFFYIFLAPLIFEAAFNTRWHIFRRLLLPILTAAFVIVLIQTFSIAAFTRGVSDDKAAWSWWPALMFGAMLSATDPIAVTATLKALGASENLGTLIEGESLVNDGSAFVLWEAFYENTIHEELHGKGELSPAQILASVMRASFGGLGIGIAFALIALAFLTFVYDEFEVETSLTLVVAFLGFWTAQAPQKLSGVIANVASGLILSAYGRPLVSQRVRHPLEEFWELIGWIANTIVFVHAGILTIAFMWPCNSHSLSVRDYMLIPAFFLFLQVIRVALFGAFYPIMSWGNKWYTWREALVVGMSGLRGSVSLIMALSVASANINESVRMKVIVWTTGIVFLSLVVNGLIIPWLLSVLGLDKPDKTREEFLRRARATMTQATLSTLDKLCVDIGFRAARWSYVLDNVIPRAWLNEKAASENYAHAAQQIFENSLTHRQSLEFMRSELHRISTVNDGRKSGEGFNAFDDNESIRLSLADRYSLSTSNSNVNSLNRRSLAPAPYRPISQSAENSVAGVTRRDDSGNLVSSHSGSRAPNTFDNLMHRRSSIHFDMQRYESAKTELDESRPYIEVIRKFAQNGASQSRTQPENDSERDREVRRRVLMTMLSHVRALSNSTLIEYRALVSLEEDIQSALDANDEGREYDLFSQLSKQSLYCRLFSRLVDKSKLSGESIVVASTIFSVLTEILKQDVLGESNTVRLETERLYDAAMYVLNELEMKSHDAFCWVHSQLAVHATVATQDVALEDMQRSGVIDSFEQKYLRNALVRVRRQHSIHPRVRWKKKNVEPRKLLPYHPLFADLKESFHKLSSQPVTALTPGHVISVKNGSLVVVLEGSLRPVNKSASKTQDLTSDDRVSPTGSAVRVRQWWGKSVSSDYEQKRPSSLLSSTEPQGARAPYHWCFGSASSLCASSLACSVNNAAGEECQVAEWRLSDKNYMACHMRDTTSVYFMREKTVRQNASASKSFRDEITRALARQLVLDSLADQQTQHLRALNESLGSSLDVHCVIGRALVLLERLPYMTVMAIHAGVSAGGTAMIQGPAVLINGVVRVSIADTSGLDGAANLLHAKLEGPALLPSGGLIIEQVDIDRNPRSDAEKAGEGPVLAHVLVDKQCSLYITAQQRLDRWTSEPYTIDMNGRFGIFRHVTDCAYSSHVSSQHGCSLSMSEESRMDSADNV